MRGTLVFGVGALLLGATTAHAQPNPKLECAAAFEKTQELRQNGKLTEALESANLCARDICPQVTIGDCTKWASELSALAPSITIIAKDATGTVLSSAVVRVDGSLVPAALGETKVRLNPGSHEIVVEVSGKERRQAIDLKEGQSLRQEIVFTEIGSAPVEPPLVAPESSFEIPTATWIAGGVGAAGLLVWIIAGSVGLANRADAEETCPKNDNGEVNCPLSVTDPIDVQFAVADVGLGVGVAGLATAVVLAFVLQDDGAADPAAAQTTRWFAGPTPSGAFAGLVTQF